MAFQSFRMSEGEDSAAADKMADLFGPGQVDQMIRQAIQFCWMGLPQEKRNTEELEKQIHRLVERALRDWREDCQAFGRQPQAPPRRRRPRARP